MTPLEIFMKEAMERCERTTSRVTAYWPGPPTGKPTTVYLSNEEMIIMHQLNCLARTDLPVALEIIRVLSQALEPLMVTA